MRDWHIHLERGPYTVEWAEQFVRRAERKVKSWKGICK